MSTGHILRVAVPSPLYRSFDYLPCAAAVGSPAPGVRVRVSFGRRQVVGVVVGVAEDSEFPRARLRRVAAVLDEEPLWSPGEFELLCWAARYYAHPVGEVLHAALPAPLRTGQATRPPGARHWRLTQAGREALAAGLSRAARQQALLALLAAHEEGLTAAGIEARLGSWRHLARPLETRGLVETFLAEEPPAESPVEDASARDEPPRLNAEQQAAFDALQGRLDGFAVHLLDGVTGSGKTEVYLRLIERVVGRGDQALVLVPEIGLTPQLVARFRRRFTTPLAVLHSGLADGERLGAWLRARSGQAAIVLGTRSAVFTPLSRPGLIIVDEEHDLSFKQQEGFRYSARDLAIVRAQGAGIPIVLGSATPSLESLQNVAAGRFARLELPRRAGRARAPAVAAVDLRRQHLDGGLSRVLVEAAGEALRAGNQVLLFLNRRGYAPVLLCHDCGWASPCRRCDARMTLHRVRERLCCHHCGAERAVDSRCEDCGGADLRPAGRGTQRVEEVLHRLFPDTPVIRVDRDSTRRRGELESRLARVDEGGPCILVGTQMLAKGHHFPRVTLAGLLDADQGLYGTDFRAGERMAQLITQVAGRAGRAERPGTVLIQTHHPDHPLLQCLLHQGYGAFAAAALTERRAAGLPPFTSLALVRAEAPGEAAPGAFLRAARERLQRRPAAVAVLGPVPAPMERRGGRYRAQLLLRAERRPALQQALAELVPALAELPEARRVRWSIDVDPQEIL